MECRFKEKTKTRMTPGSSNAYQTAEGWLSTAATSPASVNRIPSTIIYLTEARTKFLARPFETSKPISPPKQPIKATPIPPIRSAGCGDHQLPKLMVVPKIDRKSTRLNSSHLVISYAVYCLEK